MERILITGASGYIGRQFTARCARRLGTDIEHIVATDLRPPDEPLDGVVYHEADIRSDDIPALVRDHGITTVAHLAAVISIAGSIPRHIEYDIDVNGSMNVIRACLDHGVRRFITTSSGAAYGYWPSNARMQLTEDMPMRGSDDIPYSQHKWLIEEKLKTLRSSHPHLEQYVFRVGTILGETTRNPITDYFSKDRILVFRGYSSEFVIIWDQDLLDVLDRAATGDGRPGVYNVAGDDPLDPRELARIMGKSVRELPPTLARWALGLLHPLRLAPYPPAQIKFIIYRPVLDNTKLKTEFAFTPRKTTEEAFHVWWEANRPS